MAQQPTNTVVPASLLVAALGLGGWLLFDKPLSPDRPVSHGESVYAHAEMGRVPARLWQDPIEPAERYWQSIKGPIEEACQQSEANAEATGWATLQFARESCAWTAAHTKQKTSNVLLSRVADALDLDQARREERSKESQNSSEKKRLLILPILTSTGHAAEQRETRRRQRHALSMGLALKDFRPVTPAFINVDVFNGGDKPMLVPYEMASFSGKCSKTPDLRDRQCGDFDAVLVLWLATEDEMLAREPLRMLYSVLLNVIESLDELKVDKTVKVLGPANSRQLNAMLKELSSLALFDSFAAFNAANADEQFDTAAMNEYLETIPVVSESEVAATLMEYADSFLDISLELSPARYDESRRCLERAVGKEVYLYEGSEADYEDCLQQGVFEDLVDSASNWRAIVRESWQALVRLVSPRGLVDELTQGLPDELFSDSKDLSSAKLEFTQCMLEKRASWITDTSGTVSDADNVPQEIQYRLSNSLELITTCLSSNDGASVDKDLVAALDDKALEAVNEWQQANYPLSEEFPPRNIKLPVNVRSLLLATHIYLDQGVPRAIEVDELNKCLNSGASEDSDHASANGLVELYARCLSKYISPVQESDEKWSESVARDWLARFQKAKANTGPSRGVNEPSAVFAALRELSLDLVSSRATQHSSFFSTFQGSSPIVLSDPNDQDGFIGRAFRRAGLDNVSFISTIARDDATLNLLVEELRLRGLLPCETKHGTQTYGQAVRISIVHELETAYGQYAAETLKELIGSDCAEVEFFGYLRGVDGEVLTPGSTPEDDFVADKSAVSSFEGSDVSQSGQDHKMPASGPSQLDYIERFAETLPLKAEESPNKISVFVILGSDVYDKKLLMQVIRRETPAVLIATTDLDARFLAKKEVHWSQNVLVATGYGLHSKLRRLRARKSPIDPSKSSSVLLGGGTGNRITYEYESVRVPPHRDAYQTAFAYAVGLVLERDALWERKPPKLFEIGRNGAIDITPKTSRNSTQTSSINHAGGFGIDLMADSGLLFLPLILAFAYWVTCLSQLPAKNDQVPFSSQLACRGYLAGLIFVGLAFIFLWFVVQGWPRMNAEPRLFFDGISALPTWMIQAQVAALSVAYLIVSSCRVAQNNTNLQSKFSLPARFGEENNSFWTRIWIWAWSRRIEELTQLGRKAPIDADDLWTQYMRLSSWSYSLGRVLSTTVVTIILLSVANALNIIDLGESNYLIRKSSGMYFFESLGLSLASASLIVFAVLILATADSLKLGQTYIRALCRYEVHWPSRSEFGEENTVVNQPAIADALSTMDMITYRSERLLPLILMPIALLLLLMFSHSSIFEGWHRDTGWMALYGSGFIYLLYRATRLQRLAQYARQRLITRVERVSNQDIARVSNVAEIDRITAQRDSVVEYMSTVNRGAFVEWYRHPVIQSILMPLASVLLLLALQAFS